VVLGVSVVLAAVVYLPNSTNRTSTTSSLSNTTTTTEVSSSPFTSSSSSSQLIWNFSSAEQTVNSTLGLNLTLSANSTVIPSGNPINISASLTNILSTYNNLNASIDWTLQSLSLGQCNYGGTLDNPTKLFSPVALGIYSGFYDLNNISVATSLPFWGTLECPVQMAFNDTQQIYYPLNITNYEFLPNNSSAYYSAYYNNGYNTSVGYGKFAAYDQDQADVYAVNGSYYLGGNSLSSSLPSVYTVAAGDEWGQLVLLHFQVVASNNAPGLGNYIDADADCGESNSTAAYNTPCTTDFLSSALVFDCTSQAASASGCTLYANGTAPFNITVWYPFLNGSGVSTGANCKYEVPTGVFYGRCYSLNSTAFVVDQLGQ
jgi:hypothetical protein